MTNTHTLWTALALLALVALGATTAAAQTVPPAPDTSDIGATGASSTDEGTDVEEPRGTPECDIEKAHCEPLEVCLTEAFDCDSDENDDGNDLGFLKIIVAVLMVLVAFTLVLALASWLVTRA